ncbi:MAG: hypothetical protein R3E01_08125 [Pirellulaceae bacterium]
MRDHDDWECYEEVDSEEHEFDHDVDDADDDDSDTTECGHCRAEIYEDSVRCPICGEYVTSDTSPWRGRPVWWIVLGAAGILAVIVTLLPMLF